MTDDLNADRDAPPTWDKSNPLGSLRSQASYYNEEARRVFLKDGTHVELFFLFSEDGRVALVQQPPKVDKDQFTHALKDAIRQNDIYGVIHIAEAWTYFPRKPNDHTLKQVIEGEIAVSQLKPGDKTEALIVRMECRDGTQNIWINSIIRAKTGIFLADFFEFNEKTEGRYGSLFSRPIA